MKIKNLSFFIALFVLVNLVACNKDGDDPQSNENTELATHSEDQQRVSAEMDAVANDANVALESSTVFSGRLQDVQGDICDATIQVNLASNPMTITVVYDGSNCLGNRTRTGTIILSMAQGVQWKNANAEVTLQYQNFKVTRLSDNKSITLNGTVKMKNVTGGLLANLSSLQNITHSITSDNMTLTFDNGTQRTWKIARQRAFTFDSGINVSVSGTHTEGVENNVAEWGTNRFGKAFTTSSIQPLVFRQDCDFRLTSGSLKHTLPNFTAYVDFGLNANGNPVSCPNGNYYMAITWTNANNDTVRVIRPY